MLNGQNYHSVDSKNRMFVPAKMRESLGESFIIVRTVRNHCLRMFSKEEWKSYIEQISGVNRELKERINRFFNPSLLEVTPDAQGRVVLSKELMTFAGINKEVFIMGCGEYAEVWSPEVYKAEIEQEGEFEELSAIMTSLGL